MIQAPGSHLAISQKVKAIGGHMRELVLKELEEIMGGVTDTGTGRPQHGKPKD